MMNALTPEPPYQSQADTNGLGMASFIISLVGLFSAGTLSLVGMVMGAIAMRREPKGLAIAGFVIGLIGCLMGCLIIADFMGAISLAGLGLSAGIMTMIVSGLEDDMNALDDASIVVSTWQSSHGGELPKSSEGTAALHAAGIDGVYRFIDAGDYELTVTLELDSNNWTFIGGYDENGNRERLEWDSNGGSHGTVNY